MAFQINDQYGIGHNSEKRKITAPDLNKGAGEKYDKAYYSIPDDLKERTNEIANFITNLKASPDFTGSEKFIICEVVCRANSPFKRCFQTNKEIGTALCQNERAVRRALKKGVAKGWLVQTKERPGEHGAPEKGDRKRTWTVPILRENSEQNSSPKFDKNFTQMWTRSTLISAVEIQENEPITEAILEDYLDSFLEHFIGQYVLLLDKNQNELPDILSAITGHIVRYFRTHCPVTGGSDFIYNKNTINNAEVRESDQPNQPNDFEESGNDQNAHESNQTMEPRLDIAEPEDFNLVRQTKSAFVWRCPKTDKPQKLTFSLLQSLLPNQDIERLKQFASTNLELWVSEEKDGNLFGLLKYVLKKDYAKWLNDQIVLERNLLEADCVNENYIPSDDHTTSQLDKIYNPYSHVVPNGFDWDKWKNDEYGPKETLTYETIMEMFKDEFL